MNMSKFTSLDLASLYNLSPETMAGSKWHPSLAGSTKPLPGGKQSFWGIPFSLGPEGGPRWLQVDAPLAVAVGAKASYITFAHFCNASVDAEGKRQPPDVETGYVTRPGEHLADYVLVYADGSEHRQAIRRRFEINEPAIRWGQLSFAARPSTDDLPIPMRGPYPENQWGEYQTAVAEGDYRTSAKYWVYALPNPHPDKELASVRVEPSGLDLLAIAGITLYHGDLHPLQHQRLETLRVTLRASEAAAIGEVTSKIDLGIIARQYAVPAFTPEQWLANDLKGWGEEKAAPAPLSDVRLDVMASPEATLTVNGHDADMKGVFENGATTSRDGALRVEMLRTRDTWVHVTVEDGGTGKPTPVRIHFRTPDGRYLPPYGHRHEVNDNWFEDYGADLKLGSTEYAYVDGRFQISLPEGEVYVEAAKGFEYMPLRQRLVIKPGQRELTLKMERPFDLRSKGWVTADTHVHFISPQTAWLEAKGEGLNLVNLLASQWGDLYTNVGDISGDLSGVSKDDTLVWVGTENRQHIMGHMSLLGYKGQPIYPMTTSGPSESWIGDATECSLADWADRCRAQEGVVVMPHFPDPHLEVAADIILGKVDGVEIRYYKPGLDDYHMGEWYRMLNLGHRVTAVGGTDKMSAGMPVGGVRTYAYLGDQEFSFANWAKAVRAGRTFTTSGPLIGLSVEGHAPGDEITLPAGGGTIEVEAWADSVQPIHELQLVVNGKVVEQAVEERGSGKLRLKSKVRLGGSAWIAARCVSRLVLWHCWPINVAAHTSPVYVSAGGQDLFNPSDATFMLTLLDGGLTYLDTLSIPASAQKQEEIKGVLRRAQADLHRRMHAHGYEH
jgi:hypothetical protein